MDKELPCDFYFGDSRPGGIEPVDTSLLSNYKGTLHNVNFGPCYWQQGVLKLLCSDYTDIITPGDTYCLSTWMLLLLAKFTKKNVYLWTHGAYGDETGFKKWMTKFRMQLCMGAFLYGNFAKKNLVDYGVDANKMHVIYNSLSYDEQLKIRETISASDFYKNHFGNENMNLVFIGRLTKVKKLDQLVCALHKLKVQGHNFNLTFVGDGIAKDELMAMVKNLSMEDVVWFYGSCYDEKQISEFLYNADICVSPGNVGLTAMHSMTFGTPVISHNNFVKQMPEYEAIEEGRTGCFFKEDNVDSLAESIMNWKNNSTDREVVRQNCYKVIEEKFNPHVQVELFKRVIKG